MASFHPDLVDWSDSFIFGKIWARPGLEFDERMLIAIASLSSLGQLDQLRNYLYGALHDGIERERVRETIAMVGVYAGFPRAITALKCWKEVVESHDRNQEGETDVSMNEADTVELEQYRLAAREWLEQAEKPALSLDYDENFPLLKAWQRTLYAAGWVGIAWPAEYGGRGLTKRHALMFAEELARARAPQPGGSIGLEVVGPTILRYGTKDQCTQLLPPLLSGEETWCQGFSEPGAGSDLAALRTKGVRDGDDLLISGQKIWTSYATHADWCAVLVRTDPDAAKHKGISYVLVNMKSPGIEVRPIIQMTGDAEFNEVFFDEVRVPVEHVLGGFGDGWKLAMDTLGHERGGYALRRRAENESAFLDLIHALRATDEHVAEHTVRDLGRLFVELRAFEAQGRATAERQRTGDVPSPLDSIDKLSLSHTEQMLYSVAVEALGAQRIAADATPSGLNAERWVKGLMYARAGSVYGGSREIQRTLVAERMLSLPRGR